tara:strand:- start:82 stop:336 length:255 start_codon:yes stop_codon:yes gene_type:complete
VARPLGRIRTHYYVSPVQIKTENSLPKMITDPIINNVDKEFSLQLTKLIKNYVLDLVNHEIDVITDSDWFEEKIKTIMEEIEND